MADIQQPQDHLPKKATYFAFCVEGNEHHLPLASTAAEKVPGRAMRDAFLAGEEGQMRLGFLMLEASGVDSKILDVIYDQPGPKTLEILSDWLEFGDGDGASIPQS